MYDHTRPQPGPHHAPGPYPPQAPAPHPPQSASPYGPPAPYAPPGPHPPQFPGQYAPQPPPPPRIPESAGDLRRAGAILIDGLCVAFVLGVVVIGARVTTHLEFPKDWLAMAGCGLGLSFLNHVVLTRLIGASVGKYICRARVVLEKTGTRPRLPRLFKRWLAGFGFLLVWLIASVFNLEDDPDDLCGVRMVALRDMRALGLTGA
ncbi:RDD family protein [Streptomyces sp. NPDC003077]|uniref:RDD family protein n=1 Tax=Streptomyces sp. NPDC003077 TaxID=3154443 RepID=UPI0033BCD334